MLEGICLNLSQQLYVGVNIHHSKHVIMGHLFFFCIEKAMPVQKRGDSLRPERVQLG